MNYYKTHGFKKARAENQKEREDTKIKQKENYQKENYQKEKRNPRNK